MLLACTWLRSPIGLQCSGTAVGKKSFGHVKLSHQQHLPLSVAHPVKGLLPKVNDGGFPCVDLHLRGQPLHDEASTWPGGGEELALLATGTPPTQLKLGGGGGGGEEN